MIVKTLETIAILLIVWQLMSRLRSNYRISPDAKSEFGAAIDDAKSRLPRTGIFKLFKGDISEKDNTSHFEMEIEKTIVPPKSEQEVEDLDK